MERLDDEGNRLFSMKNWGCPLGLRVFLTDYHDTVASTVGGHVPLRIEDVQPFLYPMKYGVLWQDLKSM